MLFDSRQTVSTWVEAMALMPQVDGNKSTASVVENMSTSFNPFPV